MRSRGDNAHHRSSRPRFRLWSRTAIAPEEVTDADARRAGFEDASDVLRSLRAHGDDSLYRIRVSFLGPDPRIALRDRTDLSPEEADALARSLARLDRASRRGAWTVAVLVAIGRHPGRRSTELAMQLGLDAAALKRNVRKLKELGLTISLERGYRLSPRGWELLRRLAESRVRAR